MGRVLMVAGIVFCALSLPHRRPRFLPLIIQYLLSSKKVSAATSRAKFDGRRTMDRGCWLQLLDFAEERRRDIGRDQIIFASSHAVRNQSGEMVLTTDI
jgi:hypothetical protein